MTPLLLLRVLLALVAIFLGGLGVGLLGENLWIAAGCFWISYEIGMAIRPEPRR